MAKDDPIKGTSKKKVLKAKDDLIVEFATGGYTQSFQPPPQTEEEKLALHQQGVDFNKRWFTNTKTIDRYKSNMSEIGKEFDMGEYLGGIHQNYDIAFNNKMESEPTTNAMYNVVGGMKYFGDITPGTGVHESLHPMGNIDKNVSTYASSVLNASPLQAVQQKYPGVSTREAVQQAYGNSSPNSPENIGRVKHASYMGANGEILPRLQEIRFKLGVEPGQIIDQPMIDSLKGDSKMEDFINYYNDDKLIEVLNKSADTQDYGFDGTAYAAKGGYTDNLFNEGGYPPPNLSLPDGQEIYDPKYKDKANAQEYLADYYGSPMHRERLVTSGYSNVDEQVATRVAQVKEATKKIDYEKTSSYNAKTKEVSINPQRIKEIEEMTGLPSPINSVKAHEFSHAGTIHPLLGLVTPQVYQESEEYLDLHLNSYDRILLESLLEGDKDAHDRDPGENKADLDALRYELMMDGIYDAGKEKFTKEHWKKAKKTFTKDRLDRNYGKDNVIMLMNTIADNSTNKTSTDKLSKLGGYTDLLMK